MGPGLRTPPLGWVPLALVVMAHGAGLWAMAAPPVAVSPPPAGIRFALAVVPAQATLPAAAAPAPVPPPEPRPGPKPKTVTVPVRKVAPVVTAVAVSERTAQPVSQTLPPAETVADAAPPVAANVSAAPPAAEGVQAAAVLVTAPSFSADYLNNPKPDYPRISRRLGEEGVVLLIVSVGMDGRAQAVSVERPSGSPRLDEAALRSVRDWRFAPARRNGLAVPADVRVPITFSLKEST